MLSLTLKKTETYQYLPPNSSHPRNTFKSITTSETIRHLRNNSGETELKKHLINLENKLIEGIIKYTPEKLSQIRLKGLIGLKLCR